MEYYLNEIRGDSEGKIEERHAGGKARADVSRILCRMGIQNLDLVVQEKERVQSKGIKKVMWHCSSILKLSRVLKRVKKGDVLYLQFPLLEHSILQGLYFKILRKKASIILIVHDLTILREFKSTKNLLAKMRLQIEEKKVLKCSNAIISHNDKMSSYLQEMGINSSKIINLCIFDYLIPKWNKESNKLCDDGTIIIAGNLHRNKAGYVYNLPDSLVFNLYGVHYEGKKDNKVHYCGSYEADDLPLFLDGQFGLVWDGPSKDSCRGAYGEYLKINNPHKTSLYLASGIPVIIWHQAALVDFIRDNGCGITVESLDDLDIKLSEMNKKDYMELKRNAECVGEKIREGFFMRHAIEEARALITV